MLVKQNIPQHKYYQYKIAEIQYRLISHWSFLLQLELLNN